MRKRFVTVGIVVLAAFLLWFVAWSWFTFATLKDLKQQNFTSAHRNASISQALFRPVALLNRFSGDSRFIDASLNLLVSSTETAAKAEIYLPLALRSDAEATQTAKELKSTLSNLQNATNMWFDTYENSRFIAPMLKKRVPVQFQKLFLDDPKQTRQMTHHFIDASGYLLEGEHRVVVLLQNSDELRATGGFMGSYALIEFDDGLFKQLTIQDIYVPDGQFTGFVPAPPGVAEYLSSGKGMRLPDANWSPDFPTSAQEVMQFFALGKETQVETVAAINAEVVEELLRLTGPIYLKDYDQTVHAENLATVARADRDEFFPGSQQKRQFLQALFVQLKLRATELVQKRPYDLFYLFQRMAESKHIQAYAHNPELQNLFDHFNITGHISTLNQSRYLYVVESNVGINKANGKVKRQVGVKLEPQLTTVSLQFENANVQIATTSAKDRNDYINYQRLFVPPTYRVHELTVNTRPLTRWDEHLVTTKGGQQLKQIGFLLPVEAQKSASAEAKLRHPEYPIDALLIQKQSGLPNTPYRIVTPSKNIDLLLENDVMLNLQ